MLKYSFTAPVVFVTRPSIIISISIQKETPTIYLNDTTHFPNEGSEERVIIDDPIQSPRCDFLFEILMIIISHCWLGMSCRISVHAHTRQIVYYRIRASWTFVYIIKPSSLSMYGAPSLYVHGRF